MRGRRKAAILLQYHESAKQNISDFEETVRKDFERERKKLINKESINVLGWRRRTGYNGDDFIQNRFSVIYTGWAHKIPRIIKNYLLK